MSRATAVTRARAPVLYLAHAPPPYTPQYWAQVPLDYQNVYIGHCPSDANPVRSDKQVSGYMPFCTHATTLTFAGAQLMVGWQGPRQGEACASRPVAC